MKPKVGRNFTSERGEGVKGEVKNISLHWLQGIFETVPYWPNQGAGITDPTTETQTYSWPNQGDVHKEKTQEGHRKDCGIKKIRINPNMK